MYAFVQVILFVSRPQSYCCDCPVSNENLTVLITEKYCYPVIMHLTQSLEKYSKYREVFRIFFKKKKDKLIVKSPANDL